ncbi:uncharacterized protein PRCAT00000494001 [Priceomyces carsonii]|uniref:uncharacterized protein n=1 Tax=Priceomyces carsonii TaxID=28549 RepID=UPI002ED94B97|nr:unnamed protein product [Priceomyces carsonii]
MLLSTVSVLTKYLDHQKVADLAIHLSNDLYNDPNNVKGLCDLLDELDLDTRKQIYQNIFDYCMTIMKSENSMEESKLDEVLGLGRKLPDIFTNILGMIEDILETYIHQNSTGFLQDFKEIFKDMEVGLKTDQTISNEFVLSLLLRLEYFFMRRRESVNYKLDFILLYLVGAKNHPISSNAMKVLRWRMNSIIEKTNDMYLIWNVIFSLQNSSDSAHKTEGYVLWFHCLHGFDYTDNDVYQALIQKPQYWIMLQNGLAGNSHEQCKLCLTLLQLSVKMINCTISNTIFIWSKESRETYLNEWARYITLYEILRIDTSLHQAEAGYNDLMSFVSPNSLVHPSWGYYLLSTGFKATMDSVRKFSLNLLFNIPESSLCTFKYALAPLESVFLPYAMIASHFDVREMDGVNECPFGTKLSNFISKVLKSIHDTKDAEDIVYYILKVLVEMKEAFDPARIYICFGIVKGLKGREILRFGCHDKLLLHLFEGSSEGPLFESVSQTLNLKILMSFKFDNISAFIGMIGKFINFNGFELVKRNFSLISTYVANKNVPLVDITDILSGEYSINHKAIAIRLIYPSGEPPYSSEFLETLLGKLLEFEFILSTTAREEIIMLYRKLIINALNGNLSVELYDILAKVDFQKYQIFVPATYDWSGIWKSITGGLCSKVLEQVEASLTRFSFFNNICSMIGSKPDIGTILRAQDAFMNNSSNLSKCVQHFYKIKEAIIGEFYNLLSLSTTNHILADSQIENLVDKLDHGLGDYKANTSLVNLTSNLLISAKGKDLVSRIVNFVVELWENLTDSRLQLNQKKLHVSIIELLLCEKVLNLSSSDSSLDSSLLRFCKSIINCSYGRRGLLPCLSKSILNFQVLSPMLFEKINWMPEVIVRGSLLYQLRSNVFKLESVVGRIFDETHSLNSESSLYYQVYGEKEISSKINFTASVMSTKTKSFDFNVFKFIIDSSEEFSLFKVLRAQDGYEEWTRIQLFAILVPITYRLDNSLLNQFLNDVLKAIETDPSPLVRVYLEWILALHLDQNYSDKLLNALMDSDGTMKPTVVTSYERILYLLVKQLPFEEKSDKMARLLTILIPAASSNKAMTRHFSLSLICSAFYEVKSQGINLETNIYSVIKNMHDTAIRSESFGQYRSGDALLWDVKKDLTLVGLSGGLLLRLSDRQDIDFVLKEQFFHYLSPEVIQLLNYPIGDDLKDEWIREKARHHIIKHPLLLTSQTPLQTKSGAWNTIMNMDESRSTDVKRSDLIVVASLVDKPPNLGGICRLCDVLGAGLLTLHDIKVKEHQQFKSVAVTADQWMPTTEVKQEDIKSYLLSKKKEGYTLLGLEQTDKSIQLDSKFKFPEKSLILLGAEKEGIRGDLLVDLDDCIEIKQVGVIRSMNIQTATAVIVHAYSMQHC